MCNYLYYFIFVFSFRFSFSFSFHLLIYLYELGYPDGDGQYFHYLTKWMYALSRMSLVKNEPQYNMWAVDLAKISFLICSFILFH